MTTQATAVKERPILFSGPMVRAILAGQKTQTRRIVKPQPLPGHERPSTYKYLNSDELREIKPPVNVGDRLWVRETWFENMARRDGESPKKEDVIYRADGGFSEQFEIDDADPPARWRPSIFMPRWASRLILEVTGVRVERVQDISEADAEAEGAFHTSEADKQQAARVAISEGKDCIGAAEYFRELWDSLNAKHCHGWDTNPWVWVYEFRRSA